MHNRSLALLRAAAAACALVSFASEARADASGVTPPTLSRFVEATDPRSTQSAAEARVELEIEVARDGSVSRVGVIRPADPLLDAAAAAAAARFAFEPATRDGSPVPARIRYEYVFAARTPAPPTPAPPAPPAGDASSLQPAPAAAPESGQYDATARVEAPPREVTKRTLGRDEMTRIAGTRGDPLRAIELMPGVSRPGFDGMPILRGANPQDSQVFIEGAPSPGLYHLGGLASVIHSRVLESVELVPSNFSARYGRKTGGIVDVRLRDPRTDKPHGVLDLSLLDSSLVLESPIGKQLAVLGAVRRSNIDAFLSSAASSADLSTTAAPVYWDYQHVTTYRPSSRDRIRLIAYGSSDRLAILLPKPADIDPAVRGAIDTTTVFHRVQLGYQHRWDGGSVAAAEVTYGHATFDGTFGAIARGRQITNTLQGRGEWTAVASPTVRISTGLDLLSNHMAGRYSGVPPTSGEGDQPATVATQGRVELPPTAVWIHQPGAYVEANLRPVPQISFVPGLRADYNGQVQRSSLDPRISARWELGESTTIKGGVGQFTQPPIEYMALPTIGNPQLRLTTSVHTSAGIEQTIVPGVTASAEVFAKWLDGVVASTPGGREPSFLNTQNGRIFGGELFLRARPRGRFFGFLSYTLMRSERKDQGQAWRLFDRDQPHIVSAAAAYRLGRGWEVGTSFRLTSGTPYTPIASSSYDAGYDVYRARLGPPMSARNPAFFRIDLRVEKKWTFSLWSLAMYLDVQNVLNAPNREGFSYSYDYSARQGARGLPIFPSLGVRGEL